MVGGALMFRRRWRPGWTIALAILTFPIGLLALGCQNTDEIIAEIQPAPHGGATEPIAHGVGPLGVPRAFATLRDETVDCRLTPPRMTGQDRRRIASRTLAGTTGTCFACARRRASP